MNRALFALAGIVFLVGGCAVRPPADGPESGTYPVGFRSDWLLDEHRRYDTTLPDGTRYAAAFAGVAPRPILANIWYPAAGEAQGQPRMRHGDYLELPATDPRLAGLNAALAAYQREVIAQEVLGKPPEELDEAGRRSLETLLATPTTAVRDAPPAVGRFPVVIYHAGAGSSFEDNAELCEYLAASGYVVIGSTFLEAGGESFNVDARDASAADVAFLLKHAQQLPFADHSRAALVGHSAGAHATFWTATADVPPPLNALVALDTTQDYHPPENPLWRPMVERVLSRRQRITGPLLMVAEPHAIFVVADRLEAADRTYLTVPHVDHNSFITQGVLRAEHEAAAGGEVDAANVRGAYRELCAYIRLYLDAHLKRDPAARAELARKYVGIAPGKGLSAEHHPPGPVRIPAFVDDGVAIPSPRQLRPFLAAHGPEATARLIHRMAGQDPGNPLFHPVAGMSLFYELHITGQREASLVLWEAYRQAVPDLVGSFVASAELFLRLGGSENRTGYARTCLEVAGLLDPGNEKARSLREKHGLPQPAVPSPG